MSVTRHLSSALKPGPHGEITQEEINERLARALADALVAYVRRQQARAAEAAPAQRSA